MSNGGRVMVNICLRRCGQCGNEAANSDAKGSFKAPHFLRDH